MGEAPGTAGRVGAPYDSAGRLYRVFIDGAAIPSFEYSYTANGSRAGATVDAQYRTTAYSGASYTYGPNGDRATKTVAGATTSYVYDARGNLRSVATPSTTVEYLVDGLGRRVGRKLAGTLERGWIWAGNRIIAEVNPAGAITKRFVYATGRTAPDYMVEGASTYRIVTDQLGSVRAVLNAAGAVVLSISYDPFGKELAVTGTRSLLPFGFAGGLYDSATGLLRFGARDYDPDLGAWTTKDPSRFAGGLNLYGYANNDPVNSIDVDGHHPAVVAVGIAVLLVGYGTLLASDDAQIQAQAYPEMHNSPVLGILGSIGMLAPLGSVASLCGPANAAAAGTAAVDEVVAAGGGSIRQAVTAANQAGLSQPQAVQAFTRVIEASGRNVGAVVDVGGARVLTGVVAGPGQPIVHISSSGTATFGSATVSFGVGPGGRLTATVTEIVLQ